VEVSLLWNALGLIPRSFLHSYGRAGSNERVGGFGDMLEDHQKEPSWTSSPESPRWDWSRCAKATLITEEDGKRFRGPCYFKNKALEDRTNGNTVVGW
jgi:hypothetical protein